MKAFKQICAFKGSLKMLQDSLKALYTLISASWQGSFILAAKECDPDRNNNEGKQSELLRCNSCI